jgi:hypothetical protein
MALTRLLVLAGLIVAEGSPAGRVLSGTFSARPAVAAGLGRPEQPFNAPPLQRGGVARPNPFQLLKPLELVPLSHSTDSGFVQLRSKRTGVTCTMLIVPVDPSVDPGILVTTSEDRPDPIVRNELSPCLG